MGLEESSSLQGRLQGYSSVCERFTRSSDPGWLGPRVAQDSL